MNSIINDNNIGIIDFFNYLNQVTNLFVTQIETKPIKIKRDMYVTGFKRQEIQNIYTHVKHIKPIITQINGKQCENIFMLKETPEEEMWIDIDLLNQDTIRIAFNELRNYFYQLKNFEIIQLQYKLKTQQNNLCTQEETIIYDDKKIAAKETIAKRKQCTMFKSHFIHYGTQEKKYTQTEEEIAEMP